MSERIARKFARLNAGSVDSTRPRVDSTPSLASGWQDLVMACQDMPPIQWALACWLWAGWDSMGGQVLAYVEEIARDAMARGEMRARPRIAEKIARLVLTEMRHDNCRRCAGRGVIFSPRGGVMDCQECSGHGVKGLSHHERARWLGLPWTTYRDGWRNLCDHVFERVRRERDGALAHVQRRQMGTAGPLDTAHSICHSRNG